jgi:DMSO reductase anchor subunit
MNPAFSVIFLTVLSGAAQGLIVLLAAALLAGWNVGDVFPSRALGLSLVLLLAALAASFFHLGRPARAWRAAAMWRTSWLSREVIVLPTFIGAVAVWWWGIAHGAARPLTHAAGPLVCAFLAALLWYCTAKIYACLRFIEEWAQPLTPLNFALAGLASGFVLGCALRAGAGGREWSTVAEVAAVMLTAAAGIGRALAIARNARLRHRSTLQSATGIDAPALRQLSMGMTGGSFNTREFFHRAGAAALRRVRVAAIGLGYVVPALAGLAAIALSAPLLWWLAVAVQSVGLVADRWLFFAQAKHPQNLYYQVVS